MINGDVNKFVDGLHYGDEMEFMYKEQKFFIEGLYIDGKYSLLMWRMEPLGDGIWQRSGEDAYPVEEFLNAPLWNGRTFWEAEGEMEWVG